MQRRLALLHPGAMGTALGRSAQAAGHRVGWCRDGRGENTARRAADAGFEPFDKLGPLLDESDIVLSVCPPDAALATARQVADHGYSGIYLDANAVAPATAADIAAIVERGGARFVDGGVIGPPPIAPDTTWLYVSGGPAALIPPCFTGAPVTVVDLGERPTAASAIKMCYAAWTKGSSALLLAVAALARAAEVDEALQAQWRQSLPGLADELAAAAARDAPKAWRFSGEMEEIASTFRDHGLPDGFHAAAAQTFAALAGYRDRDAPGIDAVVQSLLAAAKLPGRL